MDWTYYQSSLYLAFHQLWRPVQDQASGVFDSRTGQIDSKRQGINTRTGKNNGIPDINWTLWQSMCLDGTRTLVLQSFVDISPPYARLAHQIGVRLCATSYRTIEGNWRTGYHESLESCSCLTYQCICLQLDTVSSNVVRFSRGTIGELATSTYTAGLTF